MLIHPGWVKTAMSSSDALIDVQTNVAGMLTQTALHFSESHAEVLRRFDGEMIAW